LVIPQAVRLEFSGFWPSRMNRPNVICLVIDRLHVGYLGAYGNSWINTPALDRLAAQSFVLDRAIIDSPRLEESYRSMWLGLHALCPVAQPPQRKSVSEVLSSSGWHTALLTDEQQIAEHPLASTFNERTLIGQNDDIPPHVATAAIETNAAQFFAAAANWLQSNKAPFILWLHTGTLGRTWDAPLEFRQQYADVDDPESLDWAAVPCRMLPENFDPDKLLAISHAYAGQVSLVDQLVGEFFEAVDAAGNFRDTVLVLLSPRGFPLGEHRRVGPVDEALYAELIHVPWMIRLPKEMGTPGRSQSLVQPADLAATILDCCGLSANLLRQAAGDAEIAGEPAPAGQGQSILPLIRGERSQSRDRACAVALPTEQALVTANWSLRCSSAANEENKPAISELSNRRPKEKCELFVKPDDWFQFNEVADRCGEIVREMETALNDFSQACQSSQSAVLANLPPELTTAIE
jgi:arylsulfatase A-like enzyme